MPTPFWRCHCTAKHTAAWIGDDVVELDGQGVVPELGVEQDVETVGLAEGFVDLLHGLGLGKSERGVLAVSS